MKVKDENTKGQDSGTRGPMRRKFGSLISTKVNNQTKIPQLLVLRTQTYTHVFHMLVLE